MEHTELHVLARALRQKAESLRRTGIRHYARLDRRELQVGLTEPAELELARLTPTARASDDTPVAVTGPDRETLFAEMAREVAACQRCSELARCRTQTVFGVGDPRAELCFVGEAPGADEDKQGEPFVGAAGQLLTRIIAAMGLKRSQVYICNVLKCRPPGNRTPAPDEVANCREFLDRQLDIIRPKFICALGAVAAKTLLDTEQSIGRLRGRFHVYRDVPVLCTYHPAYLLRTPEAKKSVWEDIQVLMREMGLKKPELEK